MNYKANNPPKRIYSIQDANAIDCYRKYLARHTGNITFEYFKRLTKSNCFYCGKAPNQKYKKASKNRANNESYIYNGLDRIDNSIGYDVNNVLPCCKTCNFMRHILTQNEFYVNMLNIILHNRLIINELGYDIIPSDGYNK